MIFVSRNFNSSHSHVPLTTKVSLGNELAIPPADSVAYLWLFVESAVQTQYGKIMWKTCSFIIIRKSVRNQVQPKYWNFIAAQKFFHASQALIEDFFRSSLELGYQSTGFSLVLNKILCRKWSRTRKNLLRGIDVQISKSVLKWV